MRRTYTSFLRLLLFCLVAASPVRAQVCNGDIELTSQADVDAFNCSEVEGDLVINGGDITDLSPLASLSYVDGVFRIGDFSNFGNDALVTLAGLENLIAVGEHLFIDENDVLESLMGLENLTTIGGFLALAENDALESLAGLENLTSAEELLIEFNDALESLDGLGNVTSFEGGILVAHNGALSSLTGLENVTALGGNLYINNNDALVMCSCGLSSLISGDPPAFTGVEGEAFIFNNDPEGTCTSPEVVLATPCEPVANEDASAAPQELQLEVYPNPVARVATMRYALPEAAPARLAVYDLLGREVAVLRAGVHPVGQHETRLGGLAAGVYVVRLEVGEEVRTQRVTVLR